jgi:plastocyanin
MATFCVARHLSGAGILAGLLMLAACGLSGPAYAPAPEDAAVVEMTTWLSFDPSTIEISAGDTVEWRNTSPFTHTVTSAGSADTAAGAEAFDSGPIRPGEVFRHNFLTAGTFAYVCKPHEGHDMRGTVVVKPMAS